MLKRTNIWLMVNRTSYDNAKQNGYRWIQNIENAMNNDLNNKELKKTVSVMLSDPP